MLKAMMIGGIATAVSVHATGRRRRVGAPPSSWQRVADTMPHSSTGPQPQQAQPWQAQHGAAQQAVSMQSAPMAAMPHCAPDVPHCAPGMQHMQPQVVHTQEMQAQHCAPGASLSQPCATPQPPALHSTALAQQQQQHQGHEVMPMHSASHAVQAAALPQSHAPHALNATRQQTIQMQEGPACMHGIRHAQAATLVAAAPSLQQAAVHTHQQTGCHWSAWTYATCPVFSHAWQRQ